MYLMEINSQMIGIVFNINFSTPLLNQTEQRTCLECFQTLSIKKCVPGLFIFNCYANRQHPYRWLLSRYHYTHVCLEIFIICIYIKKTRAWERVQYLAFKRSLLVLILHNQTLIKVCETKGVKYVLFRNKTLNVNKWRLKNYYLGHVALFLHIFWHLLPILILHSSYIHCSLPFWGPFEVFPIEENLSRNWWDATFKWCA